MTIVIAFFHFQLWDMRNIMTPVKEFVGHTKGMLIFRSSPVTLYKITDSAIFCNMVLVDVSILGFSSGLYTNISKFRK